MSPSSHCLRKFLRVLEYGRGILEDTGTLKTFGDLPENWGGDAGDYARRRLGFDGPPHVWRYRELVVSFPNFSKTRRRKTPDPTSTITISLADVDTALAELIDIKL